MSRSGSARSAPVTSRGPEKGRQLVQCRVQPRGVAPGAEHLELPGLAVEARLDPTHDPVADEERQYVVTVLALRLGDVHLEPVAEAPQRLGPVAVLDEAVERREHCHAVGRRAVRGGVMRDPFAALQPGAEPTAAALLELALRLAPGQRLRLGPDALRQVPEA